MINLWIVVYIPNDSQLWIVVFTVYLYILLQFFSGIIIGDSSGIFPIYPTMTSQNCFGNSPNPMAPMVNGEIPSIPILYVAI